MISRKLRPVTGFLLAITLLFTGLSTSSAQEYVSTTEWQRSVAAENLPDWFGANTERGLAYVENNGNKYLLIASAPALSANVEVYIVNAETGEDVGTLDLTGYPEVGTFQLSDVMVSEDGKIFLSNYGENVWNGFQLHMYDDINDTPTLVLSDSDTVDDGEWGLSRAVSVVGNFAEGTATIYAVSDNGSNAIARYTQTGPGENFDNTPEILVLDGGVGSSPMASAALPGSADFYQTGAGQPVRKYAADGTLIGAIPTSVVGTGTTRVYFLGTSDEGHDYLSVLDYVERTGLLVRVPDGDLDEAVVIGSTETLGDAANANGTGDIYFAANEDGFDAYVMVTNNGIGHYSLELFEPEIGTFALVAPEDGAELLVEGEPDDEVVITWERPVSNVDEDLVFTWHLDLREGDFSDPVVSIPADDDGNANQITLTLNAIDGLLDANDLDVGDVLEADWTVTAELGDDLVQFADAAFAIDLERGVVEAPVFLVETEIFNEPLRDGELPADWEQVDIDFRTAAGGYALFETPDAYLETQALDLTGFQNVELTFDVAKFGSGDDGPITVQVSEDGGLSWVQEFESPVPTSSTYLTSGPTAITASGDDVVIRFSRPDSPSQKRLRDVVLSGEKEFPAPAPEFDPAPGTFDEPVAVTITSELPDADIFYTTDGETPDENSDLYTGPITLEESTTLSAIVITGAGSGPVTTGFYEILDFVTVSTLAELREGATDGTVYKLEGEAFLSFDAGGSRNQKWIQDATAGIVIDDPSGVITTEYNVGDGITGLTGTLGTFNDLLQFTPVEDPGPASSVDNPIEAVERTLAELTSDDQGRLVRIQNVVFANAGDEFASGQNYNISDKSGSGVLRTAFSGADYIGEDIPLAATFEALVGQFRATIRVTPRSLDDMTIIDEADVVADDFALTSPPDGFELAVDGDGDTPVTITWEEAVSDFPVSYFFHLDGLEGDFSDPLVTIPSDDDGTTPQLSVNIRALDEILESLEVQVEDTVTVLWTVTAHIGDEYVTFADAPFEITFIRGLVDVSPFTTLFQLSTIDDTLPEWFGTHTERGMSAFGDNVYVVSRSDGANVLVLDAETGEVTDSLNTEGVSGGTFPLNDVEVSGDGRIYAGNLAIGDAATFKLYELHRTRAPRVVLEYAHTANNRLGDKLTIVGNWNDGGLTLYAPDGNAAQVLKFEMNGNENGLFGEPEIIGLDVVDAGSTPVVAALPDGRFFWTASGRNVHFFEADGTHVGEISSSLAATSSTALRYLGTEGDDHLLAVYQHGHVSPVGENENVRVIRIPGGDLEEAVVEFVTPSMRGDNNPNGTGEVAMVPLENGEFNLFVLGTNNGIGGYNVDALDVAFPDYSRELEFMPLAEARALPDGRMAMVKGIVNSTDFGFGVADYFIQDESGGLNVTDFDEGGAQKGTVVEPGDSIIIMGEIRTFNDQRNIGVGSFEITSRGNPLPEAIVIEGADMRADSEFQGMRVQLRDMYIIDEDIALWPEDGADQGSGVNIRITSEAEADTFVVRLARNNTAFGEGAGQPLPPAVFHITGSMGQFRQTTQLFPFFADDIVPAAEINWANVQWPPQGDIKVGEEFVVYAQIYVEGLTDVTDEASEDIQAWIGVNTENVAPTADGWTWIEADFNEDKGDNHEYMADIGSDLTAGTYYYVSRFQLQNFDFVYGGFQGGFWDGENNVSGQLTVAEPTDAELADIPKEFGIDQNYPNPFNPATNIRYAVPQTSHVTIRVYNVTGQLVATLVNETRDAGYHNVVFDGTQLASGVYIYRMQAGDFAMTRKLMLIK